jgi:hypothetical protein
MHPRLLWSEIIAAAGILLNESGKSAPFAFELAVDGVAGFGSELLPMRIDASGIPPAQLTALRRTYDLARLVELAAIAIAGIGLHAAGGHEIKDVALRGSRADYLVDDANHLLEVAGRSRRSDFGAAWRERWERLSKTVPDGYYVCVSEFETPAGKLAFGFDEVRFMATTKAPVSDMLITVKSREVQRGMLAEMQGDAKAATRHFLAAAHLELVLANEYAETDAGELAVRSQISAASCFWRGGQKDQALSILDSLKRDHPDQTTSIQDILADLKRQNPAA